MLGNKSRKLSHGKLLPPPELEAWKATGGGSDKVKLEAARKRRARVEVDVVLERECVVEGGEVRGRLEIRVNGSKTEGLRVGGGKVRVVGYEDISPQSRHIFYHHPYPLPLFSEQPNRPQSSLFASGPDTDGFREAALGMHWIPFCMRLPLSGGAKGTFTSPNPKGGPSVRYVVVGSVKLLHPRTGKRSIAHFYRPIIVLPYLNPGVVLAPCEEIVEVIERRGLGWSIAGARGVVELRIALGRSIWVSGQRIWCEVGVKNDSTKRIKSLTLALLQTVQTFLPDNHKAAVTTDKDGIPNADEALGIASTVRRKVAEENIVADDPDYGAGRVTGRRWWTGVEAGEMGGWDLSLLIPNGMISIPRSRLIEVTYTLRLTANAGANLFVDVPLTLINFLSIDPPPMPGDGARFGMSQQSSMVDVGIEGSTGHAVASTALGPYGVRRGGGANSVRSGESMGGAAVASSTTLHIDALLSAGRARAEAEAAAHYPGAGAAAARARVPRPMSMGSDYTPDVFGVSQINSPLGWPNKSPMAVPPGSEPTRPKGTRVMSYLSARSSNFEHDHPISETDAEGDEEDDEIDRAMLAAARREGRKMSLAALTRAAEREKEDYARDDLISPMRETPPTGMWLPAETPYEEVFKVLGETPSMDSRSERSRDTGAVNSPVPVPTINSRTKSSKSGRSQATPAEDEDTEEMRRLERLTIAEEQEAMASTRGSSDENHSFERHSRSGHEIGGYSEDDFKPVDDHLAPPGQFQRHSDYADHDAGRRSHDSIPEEEEPADEDDLDIGNETILEDLVAPRDDDTLRMTLPPQSDLQRDEQDQQAGLASPDPASLGSLNSGTGNTASSLRVPSRTGSALDPQWLRSVDSEREAFVQQTRSVYGSFAASAVSEQESEVGQVVEAVKRNLSIKTPSKTMKYAMPPGGEYEEMDEDKLSPTRALNIPRSGSAPYAMIGERRKHSHTPSPEKRVDGGGNGSPKGAGRFGSAPNIQGYTMKRETSAPSAPSPLRDGTIPQPIGRVFANRPSFSFNAPAAIQTREASLSPRGGTSYTLSPGPSPRSAYPPTLGVTGEPMQRANSHSSNLRNQVRAASEESHEHENDEESEQERVPQLAPSIASDSASSEGHALESPPIPSNPTAIDAVIMKHNSIPLGQADPPAAPMDVKAAVLGKNFAPVLDPNWLPGEHLLHTQVAYARTSFSAPDGHDHRRPSLAAPVDASPQRSRSRKGSKAAQTIDHSVYSHEDDFASSQGHGLGMRSGPGSPSTSSHSSHAPMLTGMQNRLKQLEARDEALRKFSVASAASGGQGYERERVPSIPHRPSNVSTHLQHVSNEVVRRESGGGGGAGQSKEQVVRKRRSYTAALGSRPIRSASDDVIDKPTASVTNTTGPLGGTTYITKRPYGTSPPVESETYQPSWHSPPRHELSFSPPSRSATMLKRNLSSESVSTTATSIEAALLRRPAGPRMPLPPLPQSSLGRAPSHRRAYSGYADSNNINIDIDPYDQHTSTSRGSGSSHVYNAANVNRQISQTGRQGASGGSLIRSRPDYLAPEHGYGADAYGSEAGSANSRSGLSREWVPPQRNWVPRGSHATDESDGLL